MGVLDTAIFLFCKPFVPFQRSLVQIRVAGGRWREGDPRL